MHLILKWERLLHTISNAFYTRLNWKIEQSFELGRGKLRAPICAHALYTNIEEFYLLDVASQNLRDPSA